MDEQLVAEKTGHRSSAIRSYKRTCDEQMVKVSDVLQANQCIDQPSSSKIQEVSAELNSNTVCIRDRQLSVMRKIYF